MSVNIPLTTLHQTAYWVQRFAEEWRTEAPLRIHSRETDAGGAPEWHHSFEHWLGVNAVDNDGRPINPRNPDGRVRTTRAFRKLRKVAVREYEVCYRAVVLNQTPVQIATWLTERAIRNGKPERYGPDEATVLLVSGIDKARHYF